MKYEIEIPNLPEGVQFAGIGVKPGQFYISGDGKVIICSRADMMPYLVRVEPASGYEFDDSCTHVKARRIPRKKVVIELEMPADWESLNHIAYRASGQRDTNSVPGISVDVRVVEE